MITLFSAGGPDKEVTVSFYNGQSAKVAANTAVYLPEALHNRITFELQLPAKVTGSRNRWGGGAIAPCQPKKYRVQKRQQINQCIARRLTACT